MTWKSGSGLTKVNLASVILLAQKGPDANAQTAAVRWVLPQGIWWKVTGIFCNLDATNAIADTILTTRFADTAFGDVVVGQASVIAPLTFDGSVALAIGLPQLISVPQSTIIGVLPEVIIPPGSSVTLTAFAGGGFNVITGAFITAEGYELTR